MSIEGQYGILCDPTHCDECADQFNKSEISLGVSMPTSEAPEKGVVVTEPANEPESVAETARIIWNRYAGFPVASPADYREFEFLTETLQRLERASWTRGLKESSPEAKSAELPEPILPPTPSPEGPASNYIADRVEAPQWVCFANGRTVAIATPDAGDPYLVIGWEQEGERWLRRAAAAEDEAGCINIGNPADFLEAKPLSNSLSKEVWIPAVVLSSISHALQLLKASKDWPDDDIETPWQQAVEDNIKSLSRAQSLLAAPKVDSLSPQSETSPVTGKPFHQPHTIGDEYFVTERTQSMKTHESSSAISNHAISLENAWKRGQQALVRRYREVGNISIVPYEQPSGDLAAPKVDSKEEQDGERLGMVQA